MGVATLSNPYRGNVRVLLLTTAAFFLTFVTWFNMAPFNVTLKDAFHLTPEQLGVLMTVNVALTIPARIVTGMLVDRYGPRVVYSGILIAMAVPCLLFALATEYWQLLLFRVLLSGIGAGFVVGIRIVSEWFPAHQVGIAEGIYGGWGNFGTAAAALLLPLVAVAFGPENGWRWAVGLTGLLCLAYGLYYHRAVQDTPPGFTYRRARRGGAMEVTSWGDLYSLLLFTLPMYLVLGVTTHKIAGAGIISPAVASLVDVAVALAYLVSARKAWQVNRPHLERGVPAEQRYSFRQVVILGIAYMVTFGGELAVASMLPQFFAERYGLSLAVAGLIAGSFTFWNLIGRPGGGWLADRFGRRRMLVLCLAGVGIGYGAMALMSGWPLALAVAATVVCSFFVQAGCGAVYASVPFVHRPSTGQVAGMVGAYGNVGAVVWLLVLQWLGPAGLFAALALAGFGAMLLGFLLKEPAAAEFAAVPENVVAAD